MSLAKLYSRIEEKTKGASITHHSLNSARLSILQRVIDEELTEKQRGCIQAVFFDNLTLAEYARQIGVNKSSTHRCYWRAIDRIQKAMGYVRILKVSDDEV